MHDNNPSMGIFNSVGMGTTYPVGNGGVEDR